jgi:hypothetical protein
MLNGTRDGHLEPRTRQEKSKRLAGKTLVDLVHISIFESTIDILTIDILTY